ncbi:uncharacterized protein J5F26_001572 isoform 1-T3 [Ciconia maguari]
MKSEIKNGELKLKSYRMNWVYPASYMGRPNVQLEDHKTIVQQHRQPSVDNQNVPTAEEACWRDVFVAPKSDFTELEKKEEELTSCSGLQNELLYLIVKLRMATFWSSSGKSSLWMIPKRNWRRCMLILSWSCRNLIWQELRCLLPHSV